MKLPEGFTRNTGEHRVPDGVEPQTCITVVYRDGSVKTDTHYADPDYWYFDDILSNVDIIGYKIEDDSACGVNR